MSILAELRASTSEGSCYLHRIPVFTMQLCSAQTVYLSPRKSHQQNPQEWMCCVKKTRHKTQAQAHRYPWFSVLGPSGWSHRYPKTLRTWRIHEHRGNSGRQAIPSYLPSLSLTWHFNLAHFICSCSWTRLPIAPTAAFTSRNSNFLAFHRQTLVSFPSFPAFPYPFCIV